MYKHIQSLIVTVLFATQVANPLHIPATDIAQASAQAVSSPKVTYNLNINTNSPQAVVVVAQKPDFDAEVMAPLKAAQAAKAEADALVAAQKATSVQISLVSAVIDAMSNTHVGVATGDVWEQLRICEAGGDYTRNSGNGYYGAYQYDLDTWANYGGFASPHLAPPAVQDAKARETQASRGWGPWPACARKLGLL